MPMSSDGPRFLRPRLPLKIWAPALVVVMALVAGLSLYLAPTDDSVTSAGTDDDVAALGETEVDTVESASGAAGPTVFEDPAAFLGQPIHFVVEVGEVVNPNSIRVLSPDESDLDLLVVFYVPPPKVGDQVEIEGVVERFTRPKVEEILGTPLAPGTYEASSDEVAVVAKNVTTVGRSKAKQPVELAAGAPVASTNTVPSDAASAPVPTYSSGTTTTTAAPPPSEPAPSEPTTSEPAPSGGGGGGSEPAPAPDQDAGDGDGSGSAGRRVRVAFTDRSATSGQYSDEVPLSARLVDGSGDAIEQAKLIFKLGSLKEAARTDARGVATVTPALTDQPGVYELKVVYRGARHRVVDETDLEILKEETALDLTEEEASDDRGKESTLTAQLVDPDSSVAIADRTIEFFAGGELIGTATTDQNGVATIEVPPRYKNEDELEARFSVDEFYLTSADTL